MAGLYGARLPWELEPHYSRHVAALTDERLESKAAIAAELAYRDAQLVEARAEAERLRALVGRQHEALSAWAAPGGVCAMCPGEDGEHSSRCILGDKDGHRAAEEWAALVAVAKEAETEPVMSDNLRAKLAHLRAVRGGEGTEEGLLR